MVERTVKHPAKVQLYSTHPIPQPPIHAMQNCLKRAFAVRNFSKKMMLTIRYISMAMSQHIEEVPANGKWPLR